jgi:regulatory protein
MKITAITVQKRDENRVNVSVDGKYRFSLDIFQLTDLGIKVGRELDESELTKLEQESQFGKVYSRALEYCLVRPRSEREIKDYLYKKTIPRRGKDGVVRNGVSQDVTVRVVDRLAQKGYVDDSKFANYWVRNRFVKKGVSRRKLTAELRTKGISGEVINQAIEACGRNDSEEIHKVIEKKRRLYDDKNKLMQYLARVGFSYDQIKDVLSED